MAYTYDTIEAQVRANVNDTGAAVTQVIDDAVNLLSNFFSRKLISTAISTVAGQTYIAYPTNPISIERLQIGTNEYIEKSLAKIQAAIDDGSYGWYDYNGQIQIIPTPTAVTAAKIWYRAGFTVMAGAGSTDVPDRLVPLLIILATWLYYVQMLSKVGTQRAEFPDMNPDEAGKIATQWLKQFNEMLNIIKAQKNV